MKIAICCEAEDASGLVAADFRGSPFLLMIDVDKNVIYRVIGKQDAENLMFARKIAEDDCEAVICGPIEKEPFEILAGAGVSRFDGSGRKAQRAFIRFLRNQLPLIRDYIGGPGPVGHSHDFSCGGEEEAPDGEGLSGLNAVKSVSVREDTLFELSKAEADALPDEIEIPDNMNREAIAALLASMTGLSGSDRNGDGYEEI